jgi:hypothetical protein
LRALPYFLLLLGLALAGYAWYLLDHPSAVVSQLVPQPVRVPPRTGAPPALDPRELEELMQRQPALLERAVDELRPQRPGHIDLFGIGFAGDGTERVFRNEVEYFARLMSSRFDADGHTLSLVNSSESRGPVPLATLENLRDALMLVGARMDRDEDVLVLFLTSHGSREHELVVDRPPLVLGDIRPEELREVLDEAGIRWRVLIVSACYSGGFVPYLRDPRTLVITAARKDRTSFGCGSESRITWFGDAFLARALNETTDFQLAFAKAQASIRAWEKQDGETASEPQMYTGAEIGPKLSAWRAGAPSPGGAVPFTGK